MRILLAGGAGDVGQHLTRFFLRRGSKVTVFDRAVGSLPLIPGDRLVLLEGDLANAAAVKRAVRGVDVVVNLAWSFADEPQTVFREDIGGQINLLEAAAAAGVKRFIYTSTATVYGTPGNAAVTEAQPCLWATARKPLYALGKCTAENLALLYGQERGLPVTILRFWWAFGDTIGGKHLRSLIRAALDDRQLTMVAGAGGAFATMEDLAVAVQLAVTGPNAVGKVYNIGSLFLTWAEIGAMIIELTGANSRLVMVDGKDWDGPAFLNEVWDLSWEKAVRELGFAPRLEAGESRAAFRRALAHCIHAVQAEDRPNPTTKHAQP
jgi:nucleoside-diphosphate-sugar epimerase